MTERLTEWPNEVPEGRWKYQTNDPEAYVYGTFYWDGARVRFVDDDGARFASRHFEPGEYFERVESETVEG